MGDLVTRGGIVIDGTGAPGRCADMLVRNGRIVSIGPEITSTNVELLDAAGAVVAPGFIDCHTHFDASLFWDARCDPMPEHHDKLARISKEGKIEGMIIT